MPNNLPLPSLAILVADDSRPVRRALATMLNQAGHQVTEAAGGAEATQWLRQRRFDLVICDIVMPETDGLELIAFIQRLPAPPRVIAISGGSRVLSTDGCVRVSLALGADAALAKPFNFDVLTEAIARVMAASPEGAGGSRGPKTAAA